MSAGDIYIRKNSSDASSVPNAGSGNEDAGWDTLQFDEGSIGTYTDPNIRLNIGLYLIMYSEYFSTTNTTNNERIEVQGEIHISGTGVVGGYGQDYIRKSSGDQECVVQGSMFLQVTSDNTDIFIRFYRTDNSTSGTVNRVPGYGGVIIIEMDDASHNFGFVSASSSENTTGTTERTLALNTSDKVDTGFSLASNQLTVTNAGRYIAHFEMDLSQTGTGREVVTGYLRKNSTTEITGTRAFCYIRGNDGCQDGALSWIGIIDLAASDSIDVRWSCPTSATITAAAGTGILQIWQLPSSADECIMEATTGNYNADANFAWDTLPYIDTASFTAIAGNSNIDVDQDDHLLVFATFAQVTDSSPQRAVPLLTIKENGTARDYICGDGYHRNSGTSNFSCSIFGLIELVRSGNSIEIHTFPNAATGTLANTKGQFSILSLDSIWSYTYSFPPLVTDVNTDEKIAVGEQNNVITGTSFEATQGTGKVEMWSDVVGTIKVTQSIDSWSDTSIQFDSVQGGLSQGTNYIVVTNNSGKESNKFAVQFGRGGYDPVTTTDADLYWTMDNTYADTGARGDNKPFNAVQRASGFSFSATPICRSNTYSWYVSTSVGGSEPANSNYTNITNTHTYRNIGGWVRIESYQNTPAIIYEEGGGFNNIYMLMMPNGRLAINVADSNASPDFKYQAYSDFALITGRPYHVMIDAQFGDHFDLYIDGVKQTTTHGGSLGTDTTMSTHSGDWSFGDPGSNLDTGGVDIGYDACNPMYLACWGTWSGVGGGAPLNAITDIRDWLFRDGAIPEHTISTGTELAMQTAIEAYDSQTHTDWPLTYEINPKTSGGDFELTLTDQVWPDECKLHISWLGPDKLTIRNSGTSNFNSSKAYAPLGGTISVIETSGINITVKDISDKSIISGARVLLEADSGGPLTAGDDIISGVTNASGIITGEIDYTSNQPVVGWVRNASGTTKYQQADIVGIITSIGLDITVFIVEN